MTAIVAIRRGNDTAEVLYVGTSRLGAMREIDRLSAVSGEAHSRYVWGTNYATVDGSPVVVGSVIRASRA